MLPRLSCYDALRKTERDSETLHNALEAEHAFLVCASDFKNCRFAEFMRDIFSTAVVPLFSPKTFECLSLKFHAALVSGIARIYLWSTKKQVNRRHTAWPVAPMENPKLIRYRTKVNLPCNSVSIHRLSINLDTSVTVSEFPSRPNPAMAKLWPVFWNWTPFIDVLKEACLKWRLSHV